MGENLRLCLLQDSDEAFHLDSKYYEGTNSNGPKFEGSLSEAINLYVNSIFGHRKLNYTISMKNEMGHFDQNSGYYNEGSCLRSLQNNETDFAMSHVHHPLMGKDLKQYPPYFSDNSYIFSKYHVSNRVKAADFMSGFVYIYSPSVWLLIFLFALIFWILIKMCIKIANRSLKRRKRIRDESLYKVLVQVLFRIDYFDHGNLSIRVISFFITLFSYFIFLYSTLSMKTDIIVVTTPKMINTYDDLLSSSRIRLLFPGVFDISERFEFAEPNSKELRLWEKSLQEVHGKRDDMMIKLGGANALAMMDFVIELAYDTNVETVTMLSEYLKEILRTIICQCKVLLLRSTNDRMRFMFTWISRDPHSREHLLTYAHSSYYKSPYKNVVTKRLSWAMTMGYPKMVTFLMNRPLDMIKIGNQLEGDIFRQCLSDDYRENVPPISQAAFALIQFKTLLICSIMLVCFAFIPLFYERSKEKKIVFLKNRRKMARLMSKRNKNRK